MSLCIVPSATFEEVAKKISNDYLGSAIAHENTRNVSKLTKFRAVGQEEILSDID